ncbi:MAG: site-specific integrase [Melioribacteraceae bacterium]
MYLSKHKSGIYYIYYNSSDGCRSKVSTKTKNKKDAVKVFKSFNINSIKKNKIPSSIKLKDLIWKFLIYSENYHTWKTTLQYKTTFNFLIKFLGNVSISAIKTFQIDEFVQHRIRKVSLHAGRKDLINIKAAFNWGTKMEIIESNPAKNLKRINPPEKLPMFFTKDEYDKLIEVIDNPILKSIVEIAVNTGMRQMEILSLRWSQVNLKDNFVILNNQNHITKGKKVRTIPLNNKCINVFEELLKSKTCEFIFNLNGKQIKQDYVVKNYKRYLKKVEINPKLNFHSLRHTFASWLVQKGVSIYQVSKLLGHADIKTTEIYAHLRAEDLRESVEMLN